MSKLRMFALVAVVALAGAACSSKSPSSTPSTTPSATTGGQDHVAMTDSLKFVPAEMTIEAGDTVVWTNDGDQPHTVTSDDASGPLKSEQLSKGQTYSHTFATAGTFPYYCTVHGKGMAGKIVVG